MGQLHYDSNMNKFTNYFSSKANWLKPYFERGN